jgi:hypothetical protein
MNTPSPHAAAAWIKTNSRRRRTFHIELGSGFHRSWMEQRAEKMVCHAIIYNGLQALKHLQAGLFALIEAELPQGHTISVTGPH